MEGDRASYSTSNRNWQRGNYRVRGGRRRKRRRKPWGERIADWTRALIAFLFSNVGIVCLVVGYTIAGAFLFTHIEGRNNLDIVGNVIRLRNVTAATLWELTSKENVFSERIWKAKVKAILENYQKKMVMAIKNGYDGGEENKRWSFAGAFLYSLTVITTIGEFTFLLHLSIRHLIKTFLSRCTSHSYSVFYNLVVRKNWIQSK
uniref:uncharacterized protein LOC117164827 n=1 Tax=Bombus vancouverensis nearcticus TaxID=2705178 RepID=UPI00143A3B98|nr:uncharacterized protein LOC117164827 [Bombus vancouverensis nearcticus]